MGCTANSSAVRSLVARHRWFLVESLQIHVGHLPVSGGEWQVDSSYILNLVLTLILIAVVFHELPSRGRYPS